MSDLTESMFNISNNDTVLDSQMCDVGPFYGLPSKVKDLFSKLRGIDDFYGEDIYCIQIILPYLIFYISVLSGSICYITVSVFF